MDFLMLCLTRSEKVLTNVKKKKKIAYAKHKMFTVV